ncbi:MAG: NAD-dependent deacylase [Candidatus Glassbacteria bacterium]|nr:NAD-dependent deacylase [Candidatus Glassbacteria bacterium]
MHSGTDFYQQAAQAIRSARRLTAFTGAGISVESGIPPFRGSGGLWNRYDPTFIEIDYFYRNPKKSWELIREIFYDFFGRAEPNAAHRALALMESRGLIEVVITQNIDNLHQEAGNTTVYEFHGSSQFLVCTACGNRIHFTAAGLEVLPPACGECGGLLKPDFVFFGEQIPEPANSRSFLEAQLADVFLLIGTSGEVMPACGIPFLAKENGAAIIEVNTEPSSYTGRITDIFLQGRATEVMARLVEALGIG